jgi:signal transduction histidine kinase/CheY-like chemotaxis protein
MAVSSISRTFLLLLVIAFSVVVIFTARLAYVYADFSNQGTGLVQNLQTTSLLSQELQRGVRDQIDLLDRQFNLADPAFPDQLRSLHYALSQKQNEYLKLNIGEQERLIVENIRTLQIEMTVLSFQAFELLRSGDRAKAALRLANVEILQQQIDVAFEELYWLQMNKLQTLHQQLSGTVSTAFLTAYGLVGGLIIVLFIFMTLLRKRVLVPLKAIHEAINRIRQGNFSARAPVNDNDEIGQVAQGFNFMAASLAESYADLEHRVEERTRELQQLQQQFVQAAKMSAVGQLISGVAHELNNPLTVILGYTELATADLTATGGDPKQIQLMRDLHFQADRCRKIVANLLQFARQVKPDLQRCMINELMEQVIQLREYEFSTRNIILVREFDPTNPALYADTNKIQQIVLNLLNNAYDAIREKNGGGTIWVRTRALEESVCFEIQDSGTGIAEPNRIFDPFYTTKEVGQGTGLGLSVCYGLVQDHQGKIQAENWKNGARFTVTLPIGKSEETLQLPAKSEARELPKSDHFVLIVDDEKLLVDLQTSFLALMNIESTGVNSGEEAIRFLQDKSVSLIISDIRMPGLVDGIQLYDWVVKNRVELRKRFLFVTGDSVKLINGELLENLSVPHIGKPFSLEEYSCIVRQLLEEGNE